MLTLAPSARKRSAIEAPIPEAPALTSTRSGWSMDTPRNDCRARQLTSRRVCCQPSERRAQIGLSAMAGLIAPVYLSRGKDGVAMTDRTSAGWHGRRRGLVTELA